MVDIFVNVRIDPETLRAVDRLAEADARKRSQVLRLLLARGLATVTPGQSLNPEPATRQEGDLTHA